jgi:mono/diheme cytochrome c family protein
MINGRAETNLGATVIRLIAIALISLGFGAAAQAQETNILAGVFTEAQAARGEEVYQAICAVCHGEDLNTVDDESPSLTGFTFNFSWNGKTLAEKFEIVRDTMPSGNPVVVNEQSKIDIIAYILGFNGFPAGDQELGLDLAILGQITVVPAP